MAQHITTLEEIRAGMAQTDAPSHTDLVYAERGTGSDRARAFTVGEIAAKGMEQAFNNEGDIEFTQVTTPAGKAYKGDIQDGKIVGRMFASIVNLIQKTLQWVNTGFGTTELVWNGLRFYKNGSNSPDYHFDNEGVVKMNKLIFNTTIGAQVRNGRTTPEDYGSMTNCETKAGSGVKPTEYLSAVYLSSGVGNDKFVLNSTKHELGAVVLVTNTGECGSAVSDHPLVCYAAADTSYATPICEIPVYHSKMFRYCGTTPSTNYPIWLPVA